MTQDSYSDDFIRSLLRRMKRIAMVGASAQENRPSYFVLKYLLQKGFDVTPVNPALAGRSILGRPVFARLADIPGGTDMVDVFRAAEHVGPIVEEAIAIGAKAIWMQLGVRNEAAAARAEAAGLEVVMNRCPKIEFGRLSGEISWSGVNSRTLSSARPKLQSGFQHFGLGAEPDTGDKL